MLTVDCSFAKGENGLEYDKGIIYVPRIHPAIAVKPHDIPVSFRDLSYAGLS